MRTCWRVFGWKHRFWSSRRLLFICSRLFDLKCWVVVSSDMILVSETSPKWGYWELSYLLSAHSLAQHTLWNIQRALTRTCRKNTKQQAKTHLPTHTLALFLFCGTSTRVSERETFLSPTSFLLGSHVCLALPSVLHAAEHKAASGGRASTRWQECHWSFTKIKNKRKSDQKLVRLWFRH